MPTADSCLLTELWLIILRSLSTRERSKLQLCSATSPLCHCVWYFETIASWKDRNLNKLYHTHGLPTRLRRRCG